MSGPTSSDSERAASQRRRPSRHAPVDEGPPTNPVMDPELGRRLLDQLAEG